MPGLRLLSRVQAPNEHIHIHPGGHNVRPYEVAPPPDSSPAVQMVNDRACQYLKAGPFAPVMGQTDFSYTSPPINTDAQAYRVQIAKMQAHVSFTAPAAGEYIFFTSANIPITVFSLDGLLVDPKTLVNVIPECSQVTLRESFVLMKQPYVLRLGPVSGGSVDVVVTPAPPAP